MDVVEVKKKEKFDYRDYVKRGAEVSDIDRLIVQDCVVCENGTPIISYSKIKFDLEPLRAKLVGLKYQETERTGGLKTTSRVFGYQPRIALRRDFCTATSLQHEDTEAVELIRQAGEKIAARYEEDFPVTFSNHSKLVNEKVRDEWKIEKTPFTSGIINKNNPLKYHFDSGNFKHVCSCMVALKKDVSGGFLACPEYGIGFEIADQSLLIFDGQSLLHGVTPIKKLTEHAHRFTVVYYALQQMWKCEPLTQEVARIRNVKTLREQKRGKPNGQL